ncbi:MAG: MBL fold metallo-hydrolase [Planctomycetota bacterium]
MSVHFCVLGSGSKGNAALLKTPTVHLLIDAGFSPQELETRLSGTGVSWDSLDAIVLTHLHADHFKRTCMKFCAQHNVEFICHNDHANRFENFGRFKQLRRLNLVRTYGGDAFEIQKSVRILPVQIPHDSPPTFGFRIDIEAPTGSVSRVGYFADLGECDDSIASAMFGVDLLALEFNHDEDLQRNSGRHPSLIQRVMSADGHLSNRQAADVFRRVLESGHRVPKSLVQLHLSRECNRAELAFQAAQEVAFLAGAPTQIFSSRQEIRGTIHRVDTAE